MNGLLVILSYLSYKRASRYPLSLASKIRAVSDNCGLGDEEVHAKTTKSGYSTLFHSILFYSAIPVVAGSLVAGRF